MSGDEEQLLRASLAHAGAPAHVIDHVISEARASRAPVGMKTVFLVVMVSGFLFGAFVLWPLFEAQTAANAQAHTLAANALMYHVNFGASMVLALLGWIFAAGAIASALFALTPPARAAALLYSARESHSPVGAWALRKMLEPAAGLVDAEAYVRRVINRSNLVGIVLALSIGALSAVALVRDVNTHSLFTEQAYIRSPFFPWGSAAPRLWSSAAYVEVGCNHIEGRNAGEDAIYRIVFRNGDSASLDSATHVRGSWLRNVELIDAQLRARNVPVRRWRWMNRDPMHPACLEAHRSWLGPEDFQRLSRLLRMGEL